MSDIPNLPASDTTQVPAPAAAPATPAAPGAASAPAAAAPPAATPPSLRLVTVTGVNWESVLDFTHLFRGFRLAINPAKLAIALLAIMLVYGAGRLFDAVWGRQVYSDEISRFVSDRPEIYTRLRQRRLETRDAEMSRLLQSNTALGEEQRRAAQASPTATYRLMRTYYEEQFHKAVDRAAEERKAAEAQPSSDLAPLYGSPLSPADREQEARQRASAELMSRMADLNDSLGRGIFDTFLRFETSQFEQLVENTLTFVRITPVRTDTGAPGQAVSGGLVSRDPDRLWRSDTVAGCIANMAITGPKWLFTGTAPMQYRGPGAAATWAYRLGYLASLTLLAVFSLLMLALAGACICRLSALELAGVERAPLKDVFLFAVRRLWVFVKAPLAPFVILLVIGLLMALASMGGAIPWVGPILLGALLFVFLAVAFVLMLLLLGILGGFNLFYPTIAVEGADSFDAMSRSFAYVYARPWRLLFYTVTSLIYGVVTFLFVSFAVYLILLLTHTFVGWGMGLFGGHDGAFSGHPALDTLWPAPRFLQLVQPINWWAMSWPEFLGACLLHFWVFLLITGIGAYVISYYFSSHTIIYLLLRRSVDGQGLREVFMDAPEK